MRTRLNRAEPLVDGPVTSPAQVSAIPVQPRSVAPRVPLSPLAGRHLLLVSGRCEESEGPGVDALAVHLESVGSRVSILPSGSVIPDLLGRRVLGRPDLVVAILPGRGSSRAAVRVAERLGAPLLALITSDAPECWGKTMTLRRSTRVAVTSADLRDRVVAAGVAEDRVELWRALLPSALASFDQIAARAMWPDRDLPEGPDEG
ncbi:MAG TPA: hypothetical protein VLL08_32960 [Kineosporiaceae bacterium]|nr:hypothetical protein [Kineosporiaceae bacterium]